MLNSIERLAAKNLKTSE